MRSFMTFTKSTYKSSLETTPPPHFYFHNTSFSCAKFYEHHKNVFLLVSFHNFIKNKNHYRVRNIIMVLFFVFVWINIIVIIINVLYQESFIII